MRVELGAVCVFCGSNRGARPEYEQAAREAGRLLAGQGIRLVYGGASEGLMGAVADAALAVGGVVTGVMPRDLAVEEPPHDGLSELHLVGTMHERKALMAELSDAFLVLPGGLGTPEEAFEAISWTQLRLQDKPTGFLNVNGFFNPMLEQLDRMVAEGFVHQEHRDGIYFDDQPSRLLHRLAEFESPDIHKWIDRDLRHRLSQTASAPKREKPVRPAGCGPYRWGRPGKRTARAARRPATRPGGRLRSRPRPAPMGGGRTG